MWDYSLAVLYVATMSDCYDGCHLQWKPVLSVSKIPPYTNSLKTLQNNHFIRIAEQQIWHHAQKQDDFIYKLDSLKRNYALVNVVSYANIQFRLMGAQWDLTTEPNSAFLTHFLLDSEWQELKYQFKHI